MPAMDLSDVLERCQTLRTIDPTALSERYRIRAIMNGGTDGIYAVMAWDLGKGSSSHRTRQQVQSTYGVDLPTVNLVASGMRKLAQSVGRAPTLKAPIADNEDIRRKYEAKTDVVRGWDHAQAMELQYPQLGRWLPGYSQIMWKIKNRAYTEGTTYPYAEMIDPYDIYPGWFGPDAEPREVCRVRKVPLIALKDAYGEAWDEIYERMRAKRAGQPIVAAAPTTGTTRVVGWEGPQTGVEVLEYHHEGGAQYVIPEIEMQLTYVPNPLDSGPAFVLRKKFDFDRQLSHYHHVIGLMSMMAKLNIIGLIQAEDSAFRETNIIGEGLSSQDYQRGRFATNVFEPGTRIEKPTGDPANQVWAQVDRLERQLRIGAGYDVSQDGQSPNSFATGASIRELGQSGAAEVREYQLTMQHAIQSVDAKRLEWAQALWASERRKVFDMSKPNTTYKPSSTIKGDFRTRRVYGAMATWDDATKAVTGLQYLQAGVFDIETVQEGVDGLESSTQILTRNRARRAEEALYGLLAQPPEMRDPATVMALVEIMKNPDQQQTVLEKYLTPEEPAMTPEQEQFAMAGGGPPGAEMGGPPEAVTSVLSRLEADKVGGGVQTVGQLG